MADIPDSDDLAVYEDEGQDVTAANLAGVAAVVLSSGQTLDESLVQRFLLGRPAQFITIIGDRDSGKSTLISALYDRLLRGPFAGFSFVASRSLVAFEKRLHLARIESGKSKPDTPRTSRQEGLLHFHIALTTTGKPTSRFDLMLSDRAGEVYRDARGDTSLIASLPEIPRADRLVILVDGGRIADPLQRANAMQSARQMLRALIDNHALNETSKVQVVITKMDMLPLESNQSLEALILNFEEKIQADFSPRLGHIDCRRVAARDPSGQLDPALGIDALLQDWSILTPKQIVTQLSELDISSEFDRLLLRSSMKGAL